MPVPMINFQMKCGHVSKGPATLISGVLYCGHHDLMSPIVDVLVTEWRAKCQTCRYARWAGVGGKQTGEIFANGHIRRNTGHRVSVEFATNPDAEATKIKFDAWHGPAVRT